MNLGIALPGADPSNRSMQIDARRSPGRCAALVLACVLALAGCNNDTPKSLIESGKAYLAKKEPRNALIQFKAALQADPQSAEARFLLGQALLDAGDPAGAALELSRTLDQHYDDAKVLPPLARALLLSGGAKKLATLYGEVTLGDKAANASLKSSVASAWALLGETAKAQAAIDAAVKSVPDYAPALLFQARLKTSQNKFDEALQTIEQVLAREPANYEAWYFKGEVLTHGKSDPKAGEEAYGRALAVERAFVPAHLALIGMRLRSGDIPGAKAQADQLRAVLPKHPQTLFVDAQIALFDKNLTKARELTQQVLRVAPDNVGVLQLAGAIEGQSGALVVAETYFSKALQINPELPLARRNLARIYLLLGQPVKALRIIEPIIGANSNDAEALALAGEAQLQLGDARAAEPLFVQAAKISPSDTHVRTALALMKLSRGDSDGAFTQMEAISAEGPDTFTDMALISARLKRKEYDAALRAVDGLSKKQPNSATVFDLRGRVQTARKDYAAARAAFEQALVLQPSLFAATSNLAALDQLEGKPEQARKRLEAAVAADPRNHFARMALASLQAREGATPDTVRETLADGIKAAPGEAGPRLQLIQFLLGKKQFKAALAVAQEANAALPNDADVLDLLGVAQMRAGDTQQAVSSFRKLASLETKSARAHMRLADLLKSTGNRDGAVASLRRALEIEPGLEAAQTRIMDILIADGKPKDALEMARGMQQRAPTSSMGYLLEGAIRRRTNAVDAAIEAYRNGVQRATDKSDIAIELHKALMTRPRPDEADRFAASWIKDHPSDLGFEYYAATVAILRGELERAETQLTHVLSQQPNHALALNNLAWVLTMRGKPGAVAHAQKALELLPNRPAVMDTLAMALAADKQLPKALELQKKAVEIAPGDMSLRLDLARIALQAGDKALARTELDKLAALGPKLPFQGDVAKLLKTL